MWIGNVKAGKVLAQTCRHNREEINEFDREQACDSSIVYTQEAIDVGQDGVHQIGTCLSVAKLVRNYQELSFPKFEGWCQHQTM